MQEKNHGARVLCGLFCGFLGLFFLLRLALPVRDFSENENRKLAQPPKLTLSGLFSGSFTQQFEKYLTDQFPFRDRWIDLKARLERLSGRTENNNVFFCGGDTLITRFSPPEEAMVSDAIQAVLTLRGQTEAQVCLALIPSAAAVWSDRLPANANTADQQALIDRIYAACGGLCADISGALTDHAAEDIFYRTDHHWTTLGAYYGYAETARALGLTPTPLAAFTPETVSRDFYGTVYSSSGVRWVAPDSIDRYVPDTGVTVTRYESGEGEQGAVYHPDKLETKDQYAYFLGGNTPRLRIDTGSSGGRLLVLRDSYADCELPFFFAHYSEIHVLDLRYYRQSIRDYMTDNGIDTVLVSYSLSNFVSDTSVFLMGT